MQLLTWAQRTFVSIWRSFLYCRTLHAIIVSHAITIPCFFTDLSLYTQDEDGLRKAILFLYIQVIIIFLHPPTFIYNLSVSIVMNMKGDNVIHQRRSWCKLEECQRGNPSNYCSCQRLLQHLRKLWGTIRNFSGIIHKIIYFLSTNRPGQTDTCTVSDDNHSVGGVSESFWTSACSYYTSYCLTIKIRD